MLESRNVLIVLGLHDGDGETVGLADQLEL